MDAAIGRLRGWIKKVLTNQERQVREGMDRSSMTRPSLRRGSNNLPQGCSPCFFKGLLEGVTTLEDSFFLCHEEELTQK